MALCEGKDIVCIVATGAGKSALIQGPGMIYKAAGKKKCVIFLVPTKALADDQAREANNRNIKALALHEDSTRAAAANEEDLFKKIKNGDYELIFLGPEMLISPKFSKLLESEQFIVQHHRRVPSDVKRLRDWVLSRVAWGAVSATVAPVEFKLITSDLGFAHGRFELLREPVDRLGIKYVVRHLKHPVSGKEMLDFSWIIPVALREVDQIPITVVFVNHTKFGH